MLFSATGTCSAGDTAADCTTCNTEMHRVFAFVLIISIKKVRKLVNANVKQLIQMMDHKNNA